MIVKGKVPGRDKKRAKSDALIKVRRTYRGVRRAAATDETRARIVAAARTLLGGGEGLPAFSLDGVARQAGVTRLTVYNQFESKLGLLEAVFDDVAQRGGLFTDLPAVFAEPDAKRALRRLVSVFCRFWGGHDTMMLTFHAVIKLDEEIAAALKRRSERRRQILTVLVERLLPNAGKTKSDLVDVLFALSSFEMFEALSVHNRSTKSVEALIQSLVEQTVRGFSVSRN
jgi:AcrR family transcriptional regulator